MIPAKKNAFWEWGFHLFLRPLFQFHFEHLLYKGDVPKNSSHTLFLVNHSTWWDPLVIFLLNKHAVQSNGYGMMHEEGLSSFPIFRRIGTFSINRSNAKDIITSLSYAKDRIDEGSAVWMFPQGDEQPLEQRPLQFQSGASYIIQQAQQVNVIPVSLYYTFEHTRKANVYASFGQDLSLEIDTNWNRKETTTFLEKQCSKQLNQLKQDVIRKETFQKLF